MDDDHFCIYYNIFHITVLSDDIFAHILNICDNIYCIAKYLTIANAAIFRKHFHTVKYFMILSNIFYKE